ncbi:MAG: hypothetical protein ACI9KE_005164, partial [Polyangiales bacterium]
STKRVIALIRDERDNAESVMRANTTRMGVTRAMGEQGTALFKDVKRSYSSSF